MACLTTAGDFCAGPARLLQCVAVVCLHVRGRGEGGLVAELLMPCCSEYSPTVQMMSSSSRAAKFHTVCMPACYMYSRLMCDMCWHTAWLHKHAGLLWMSLIGCHRIDLHCKVTSVAAAPRHPLRSMFVSHRCLFCPCVQTHLCAQDVCRRQYLRGSPAPARPVQALFFFGCMSCSCQLSSS